MHRKALLWSRFTSVLYIESPRYKCFHSCFIMLGLWASSASSRSHHPPHRDLSSDFHLHLCSHTHKYKLVTKVSSTVKKFENNRNGQTAYSHIKRSSVLCYSFCVCHSCRTPGVAAYHCMQNLSQQPGYWEFWEVTCRSLTTLSKCPVNSTWQVER
jgi:hypothetical protein